MRTLAMVLLPVALALTACATTSTDNVSSEIAASIPDGANLVLVSMDVPADSAYRAVYNLLARRGYAMRHTDADMHTLTTEPNNIGEKRTLMVTALVESGQGGSVVRLRGSWGVTSNSAAAIAAGSSGIVDGTSGNVAEWGSFKTSERAFGELAMLAQELPGVEVFYRKE